MRRATRLIALGLIAIGTVVAGIAAVVILAHDRTPHPEADLDAMTAMRRGFEILLHSKWARPLGAACAVAAVGGLALAALAVRGHRFALALAAIVAAGGIAAVWAARWVVWRMDDGEYVGRASYVRAATKLAIAATGYFAVIAVTAGAAFVLGRPPRSPPPPPPDAGA